MGDVTMAELEAVAGRHSTRQASEVSADWRAIVREAREQEVIVTNSNLPEAVVMSAERYVELQEAARANDPLRRLREEFHSELAVLRAPDAGDQLRDVFAASPNDIADAAGSASHDDE